MRVCHLTSVHPYTDTRIFVKECCTLADYGFEVFLVAPNAPNKIVNGVQIVGVEKVGGSRFTRMTDTTKKVYKKALEIDADIYHFHDPELIPIGLKLKNSGKKVIYDVHEDVPEDILLKKWIPFPFRKLISLTFKKFEHYAAKKFDKVITSTEFIKERFLKIGCNSDCIYNYPLLNELINNNRNNETFEIYPKSHFCYVGGISKNRGLFEMLRAISIINGGKLLMAGNFTSEVEKNQAKKESGWKKTEYLGVINREEVADALSTSLAGLVVLHPKPTFVPSLPIKMFEYMSAGIPVIASNFPLWKEIIEGNKCGICVDPLDIESIANAMRYLKNNPEIAMEMGRNGRVVIEEKFNWEAESKKLISIYNSFFNK